MLVCPGCQNLVPDRSAFCNICGTAIATEKINTLHPLEQIQITSQTQMGESRIDSSPALPISNKSKFYRSLIIFMVVVAVAVGSLLHARWVRLKNLQQPDNPNISSNTQPTPAKDKQTQSVVDQKYSNAGEDAKMYIQDRKWHVAENILCDFMGGAYTTFTDQDGELLTAQGNPKRGDTPPQVSYSNVTGSGFDLQIEYPPNDLVKGQLGRDDIPSGKVEEHVSIIGQDQIRTVKRISELDLPSLLQGVAKYVVTNEDTTATACGPAQSQQAPAPAVSSAGSAPSILAPNQPSGPDFNSPFAIYSAIDQIREGCLQNGNNRCAIICGKYRDTLQSINQSLTGDYTIDPATRQPRYASTFKQYYEQCRSFAQ
jgi:hypothetical protein